MTLFIITCLHDGGILSVNKNRAKCGNLTIIFSMLFAYRFFATGV